MAAPLTVKRARVTGTSASRGDVERWLTSVAVDRLGLAADEIFYVPQLRMRAPAHPGAASSRIPGLILEALRAELAAADSGWGEGFVPGRAYRFTSRSRYFAWLVALRVKDGSAPARAAFVAATGEESLRQWQRVAVLGDGAAFVATVAHLAEIGCAALWIMHFEPADISLVQRALEHHFGIRLDPAAGPTAHQMASEAKPDPIAPVPPPLALLEAIARLEPSGNHWHALPQSGKALLFAAVLLARNPSQSTAQAAGLAAAIVRLSAPVKAVSADPTSAIAQPQPTRHNASSTALLLTSPGAAPRTVGARQAEQGTRPPAPTDPAVPTFTPVENPATASECAINPAQTPLASMPGAAGRAGSGLPVTASLLATSPSVPSKPAPFLAPDARFETGFGGLLFLINAFIALGLYPDFTQPKGARLEPSPLWLADRIGRFWFGSRYRGDPLARWIAAHAAAGQLPRAWRAEPDWLASFETRATPHPTVRHGRVTLWHPAGFPLTDEEKGRSPRRLGRTARFRRPRLARISHARLPSNPSDRWVACLALYLDARLRLLCGAGLSLLELPACIQTRDLDLSAHFALDHHPIQLRIAGLDRDPGWQPAEGRTIAFVFE
ncbi:MAG: hypothetical protein ABI240_03265 [Sphingomonas sp.]